MPALTSNGLQVLDLRYLEAGETPDSLWDRVSMGNSRYRDLLVDLRFLPNSPTLFNLGRNNGCTLSACFTADTVIHTLGGDFTVAELLEAGKTSFKVYSTDGERLRVGEAFGLRKTRENADVYEVTFDVGGSIKLTADHLMMMRDGSYRRVDELHPGDSLMPFNYEYQGGYRIIWQRIDSLPIAAYKWSFLQAHSRWAHKGWHIHHCDFNKANDDPGNLREMTEADHASLHASIMNPMHRPGVAAKISALMRGNKRGVGPKPGTATAMIGNQHARGVAWTEERRQKHRERMRGNTLRRGSMLTDEQRERLREVRRKQAVDRSLAKAPGNHKVVSIRYVGKEDVYDLSVHRYHNFAANGVFIHNCFVFDVADCMLGQNSIVHTREKAIAVAKAGGGTGYYLGNIRQKGALVRSIHRKACGPVAVLRDYQGIHLLVTQGGKRDIAQMAVLPCWHGDIREFIHCKDDDPQALSSFNLSVSWTDEYLERALVPGTDAASLWEEQVDSAWRHGCPGMFFVDEVNRHNPNLHLGLINSPNPCGETPNRNDEPCSLGSLNLVAYYLPGQRAVDWEALARDAYLASCFMDDILEVNRFPCPEITAAARLTRKLGLGVMGWADLLALLHIHYDTPEAVDLAEKVMECVKTNALHASVDRAINMGPYPGYSEGLTEGPFCRNETLTSIAPTGTISLIAGCSSGIEPHYALTWDRTTKEGLKLEERIGVWDRLDGFTPKTAHEISPEWHIRHQAAFQKYTDLGVSKTINLPKSATRDDVSAAYWLMYKLKCKGGTVFRDGCRSEQVLVSKARTNVFLVEKDVPRYRPLPSTVEARRHKFRVAGLSLFLHTGHYEDGTLGEIFLRGPLGSTVGGMMDSWAVNFSVALQSGVDLKTLIKHHKNSRFEPSGVTGDSDIPVCTSIPDYVVRWLERRYVRKEDADAEEVGSDSGMFCPECGSPALFLSGCLECSQKCGWTRCG